VLVNAALTFDRETGFYCNEGTLVEITSSVKSEKALKESERALSTLMSNLPGMAYRCLYDENWTMLFVSSGCLDLTGYKSEELLHNEHTTYSDIVHPQDKFVGREQISQSLKTRKPFEIEYRIINKAGEVRWVWEKGEPVFDENKNLLFLEGFITDVTDRKEYEGRIKQNNENYKSVFENIPDGILIHDFNNIIQFINPAALKIFGIHSIKELKSHLVQDNIHPSKIEMALERRRLVASGQQVPFVRTIVNRQNGESLEVESRISLINYEGEKAFLVVWRDTSTERELEREQIRAEAAEQNNKKLQQEVTERRNAERNLRETQKYTRMLIDSSIDMICATDREGLLTEFNPAAQKVFGYKANEVMGKHVSMLYSNPDDRKAITNDKLYKDGAFAGEVINKKKDGTSFPAFLSASALKDESGNIIGAMGVSRDITEIKKTEQNIKASEERYRAIYNQAYIAIAQIDREGNFLQVNDQLSKIIGYSSKQLLLKNITDLTHPDDRNKKGNKNKAFIIGEKENTTIEKRYIHSSGAIVFASVTMSIVRDEKNKPDYAIVVIQDITEKKKADRQIKTQAAKLNAIIESSSHHIWTINGDMALTSFNRNYSELMHRRYQSWVKIGDNIVSSAKYNSSAEYNNYWQKKYKEAFAGKSQQFEASFIEKNGTASWLEVYLNPIVGADGAINEVSGIGHDITEKKISEEQIRQSLKEKEVLLKEVHHRVKNNIQVISSILNLQSSYVKDANTINMLKECQNRIKSMAFIHESLYQTKDFSKINFQEYLTKLVQNLVYSYEMQNSNIKLNTEVDNIMLNLDQSIPCGLIVNELISNALKYAFKGRKRGEINVEVKQGKDDYISITVADNGVGLPEKFDYKNTDSLGLQLVVTLTEQLSGNIKLFRKKGTKFTIAFKHQPVKSRI
jgi:PAS domain S-box-containing protein